jgi:hypothetical protein
MVKTESPQYGMASEPGSDVNIDLVRELHYGDRRVANSTSLHLSYGGLTHKRTRESSHATS